MIEIKICFTNLFKLHLCNNKTKTHSNMKASQILLLIFVLISFNLFSQSVEEYCQLGEEELSNDNFQKV